MKNKFTFLKTRFWAVMLISLVAVYSAKADVWPIPNGNADTLEHFIENTALWNAGDTIMLTDVGPYIVNDEIDIHKTITIIGDPGLAIRPRVDFYVNGFQVLDSMLSITIKDLRCSGYNADSTVRSPFLLQYRKNKSYQTYYNTIIDNVEAWGFKGGIDLDNAKHCYYDTIIVNNCVWSDFLTDFAIDPNINFSKYVKVTNSTFYKMPLGFIKNPDYYKVDPAWDTIIKKTFVIDHNTFYKVGGGNGGLIQMNDPKDTTVTLTFTNNIVYRLFNPAYVRPFNISKAAGSFTFHYNLIDSFDATDPSRMIFNLDSVKLYDNVNLMYLHEFYPEFKDTSKFDFTLTLGSPVMTGSSTSGPLGDPRWVPQQTWVPGPNCHLIPNSATDTLEHFIENHYGTIWHDGDTIMLVSSSQYDVTNTPDIKGEVTIMGDPRLTVKPSIYFIDNGFRLMQDSISVVLKGFNAIGWQASDSLSRAAYLIRMDQAAYKNFKNIIVEDIEAYGFTGGIKLYANKYSIYDSIIVNNVIFHDMTNQLAIELGQNLVKYVSVTNSTFYRIQKGIMGEFTASTDANYKKFDKKLIMERNTFYNIVDGGTLFSVQNLGDTSITVIYRNNIASTLWNPVNARPFRLVDSCGTVTIENSVFYKFNSSRTGGDFNLDSIADYSNVTVSAIDTTNPYFLAPLEGKFNLPDSSDLLAYGTDGGPVGDPRWIPVAGVSINPLTSVIIEGTEVQLSAEVNVSGDKTVTWSVVDGTGTATINATTGLLNALTDGTVTVKVISNFNPAFTDEMVITIEPRVLVTSISLSAVNAQSSPATSIESKASFLIITAVISPGNATDKSLSWSFTGDGKATLEAQSSTTAKLTAIQCGTVTVRATANDGSDVYGEMVVAINNQTPVTAVTVTGTDGATAISTKGGTLQMLAEIAPDTACIKDVTWSVDKAAIATISETGLLTAVANGTVVVTARATDGSYKSGTATITISNQTSSISDFGTGSIELIPNPANDYIRILSEQRAVVTITNIVGSVVLCTETDPNVDFSISNLKAGVYIVNIKSGDLNKVVRLVIE